MTLALMTTTADVILALQDVPKAAELPALYGPSFAGLLAFLIGGSIVCGAIGAVITLVSEP